MSKLGKIMGLIDSRIRHLKSALQLCATKESLGNAGIISKTVVDLFGGVFTITTQIQQDYTYPRATMNISSYKFKKQKLYKITMNNTEYIMPGRLWKIIDFTTLDYTRHEFIGDVTKKYDINMPGVFDCPFLIMNISDTEIEVFTEEPGTYMFTIEEISIVANPLESIVRFGNPFELIEGIYSTTEDLVSLCIGGDNDLSGRGGCVIGDSNSVTGDFVKILGNNNKALGRSAVIVGSYDIASGNYSVAIGAGNESSGNYGNSFGFGSIASGEVSNAQGYKTTASGQCSHSEGNTTTASGADSHAEGNTTTASGFNSHAEGNKTVASESYTHAEGFRTTASGVAAHSEGARTVASGNQSHSEGVSSTASGYVSHAGGLGTIANHKCQKVFGSYNVADPSNAGSDYEGNFIEIVGNGSANNARSNARTLDWSGNEELAGSLTLGKGTANEQTITAAQLKALIAMLPS